jgi:hypothetical protein
MRRGLMAQEADWVSRRDEERKEEAITHKPRERRGKGKERTHTIMRKSTTTFQRATNTRRSLRLRKRSKSLLLRPSEGSSKECSFEGLVAREKNKEEKEGGA